MKVDELSSLIRNREVWWFANWLYKSFVAHDSNIQAKEFIQICRQRGERLPQLGSDQLLARPKAGKLIYVLIRPGTRVSGLVAIFFPPSLYWLYLVIYNPS